MTAETDMIALRQRLHAAAELSGCESETASIITETMRSFGPDRIIEGLGGHGIAAIYVGKSDGPTILVRADMDALPLEDDAALSYRALRERTAHRCGHDGHMASLAHLGQRLSERGIARGKAVLLFQPAEETGTGARSVLDDEKFQSIKPDMVLAQHNLPGYPLSSVILREGVFASASSGLIVRLRGRASHASEPERGASPMFALTQLAQQLTALPQTCSALHQGALVTVVGLEMGGENFGITPGEGRVMATLRAHDAAVMERLSRRAEGLAQALALANDLHCEWSWTDEFPSTTSDSKVVETLRTCVESLGLTILNADHPFSWSEDFGHFSALCPGAFFGMGSGLDQPDLHADHFDFPDQLIAPTAAVFEAFLRHHLGAA